MKRVVDYCIEKKPFKTYEINKVPFPPGVLSNLYPSPENIKERLEEASFADRMKAAKAAKRKE